jgi:tetratricopeptide (TPR) repeat protein
LLGLVGLFLLLNATPIYDAWAVNQAGVLVNRVLVAGAPGDTAAVAEAARIMQATAERGPFTAGRQARIWRTYGAAAALQPTDKACALLVRAGNLGWLDRVGELWLGEVATATGHWDEASQAYQRVDVSNILISRGDDYLKSGDKASAVRQYRLAKLSLDAAMRRESAALPQSSSTAADGSLTAGLMTSTAERVTALYRVGKGLLLAGEAEEAVPVLEEAFDMARSASPGAVVEQSLTLNLALALARTLPAPPSSFVISDVSYYPQSQPSAYLRSVAHIRGLVYGSIDSDRTAPVCVQAARTLLIIGDDQTAVTLLREAIELDPLMADAYLMLGTWYESKGMKRLPWQLYSRAIEQLPDDTRVRVAYALASYRVLSPLDALPILEEAAATDTDDAYLFGALGDCYLTLGDAVKARQAYEEGLRRAPSSEPLLERLTDLGEAGKIPR